MKITNKKLIDSFKKAVAKNDIKEVLAGVLLENIEGVSSLVCTDSYRLHKMFYVHGSENNIVMNYKKLSIVKEKYPDYNQIIPKLDNENFIKHYKENETFVKNINGVDYEYENNLYDVDYINQAIEFLKNVNSYYNLNENIKLYKDNISVKKKPLMLYLNENNYAIIMHKLR